PSHVRPLCPQRRVRKRRERLVERMQLVCDHGELLAPLFTGVEPRKLQRDAVEPREQRLELAVGHLPAVHGRSLVLSRASPSRAPTAPIATSTGEPWRPRTNSWCTSSLAA